MADLTQYCTFHVAHLFLGIDVHAVQEVMRPLEMTPVPLATPSVIGLINLRGQIVTAVDLRRRLALPERPPEQEPMNVVMRTDDGAVSLIVDEIGDVIEVTTDTWERVPDTLQGESRTLIKGVYKLQDQLLLILDTSRVALPEPTLAAA
jgi:purine-binding chemotaxis protein CheW